MSTNNVNSPIYLDRLPRNKALRLATAGAALTRQLPAISTLQDSHGLCEDPRARVLMTMNGMLPWTDAGLAALAQRSVMENLSLLINSYWSVEALIASGIFKDEKEVSRLIHERVFAEPALSNGRAYWNELAVSQYYFRVRQVPPELDSITHRDLMRVIGWWND
jgi:hypothetical protein